MASIGIFDSGLGGLSVWREVVQLLPHTQLIYVADQGRCPYGPQASEKIREYAHQITDLLIDKGCELIVIACNTATAAAIASLRKNYKIPIVGMEPALKPAALQTQSGRIAILATAGTFNGDHFRRTQAAYGQDVCIHLIIEERLVEIVENEMVEAPESKELLQSLLIPVLDKGVDQIVLGCTHYPFLIPLIKDVAGNRAQIIDPSRAVAMQAKRLWENKYAHSAKKEPVNMFYTSGNHESFVQKIGRLIPEIQAEGFYSRKIYW